jgi:hypothetical protein
MSTRLASLAILAACGLAMVASASANGQPATPGLDAGWEAGPREAAKWTHQTMVAVPDGDGQWVILLSMFHSDGAHVTAPVGRFFGAEIDRLELPVAPGPGSSGLTRTGMSSGWLEGLLLVDPALADASGLERAYEGRLHHLRIEATDGAGASGFVGVVSGHTVPLGEVLAHAQKHYESTLDVESLATLTWDEASVAASESKPTKRPTRGPGAGWWNVPVLLLWFWDLVSPQPDQQPAPTPAPTPAAIATCVESANTFRRLAENQCLNRSTACERRACLDCASATFDAQVVGCNSVPMVLPGMGAYTPCLNILCE